MAQSIRKIPSVRSKADTEAALRAFSDWFYEFPFDNGASTAMGSRQVLEIHESRALMIFPYLDDLYAGRWGGITCCDVACNQGWFATQIAVRGAKSVTGIDARDDHILMADRIRELSGLPGLSFRQGDLYTLSPERTGRFTLTLFLGILYHLDNPMGALRVLRSITEHLCVIETQVVPRSDPLECTWGSATQKRSGPGIAVIASDEKHVCGGNMLTFVPSIEAVHTMLFAAGFSRVYQCVPPQTLNEQFRRNDRIILFAFV